MRQKGIAHILLLIVVVLVAIGAVGYLGYQNAQLKKQTEETVVSPEITNMQVAPTKSTLNPNQPSTTENWVTYINEQYGFSFKYPAGWTEKGKVSELDTTIVYVYANEEFGEGPEPIRYYIWVTEGKNPNKLPFKEWATKDLSPDRLKELFTFNKESTNEYTVYKTEGLPSRFGALNVFFTKDESQYIFISLTPYNSEGPYVAQEKYLNIFNQILSTFEFTE